jgi:hypothetical protein
MKDIYEVIRQKEADMERIERELEALRLSAKLLEDNSRTVAVAASAVPAVSAPTYNTTPSRPASTGQPTATPTAWASAKQFP